MCGCQEHFVLALYKVFHQPMRGNYFSSETLRPIYTQTYTHKHTHTFKTFKATVICPSKNKVLYNGDP